MKRKFKNLRKGVFIVALLAIVINVFAPYRALAIGDTITLTFSAEDNDNYTLEKTDGRVSVNGNLIDILNYVGPADISVDQGIVTNCSNNQCTVVIPTSKAGRVSVRYNSQAFDLTLDGQDQVVDANGGTEFTGDVSFVVKPVQNDNPGQGIHQGPSEVDTILFWSCGNGTCFHEFTGENAIPVINTGYFIKADSITDDAGSNYKFDVNAKYKNFADVHDVIDWLIEYGLHFEVDGFDPNSYDFNNEEDVINAAQYIRSNIDFSQLNPKLLLEHIDMGKYEDEAIQNRGCTREVPEDEFHACVDEYVIIEKNLFVKRVGYQPVGEPYLQNAYVSYADRNFKAIIYNDNYKALSIGSLEGLSYYPGSWKNELTRQDSYDISETTKDKPTDITAILLERTINLVGLNYNGFTIKSIEALDVPKNAVNITKENDGSYTFQFSSNFYDKVVFKVTDTANHSYYFRIVRTAITANGGFSGDDKFHVDAEIYYNRNTSYTNYLVTAKCLFNDGTTKIIELKNANHLDDGLGNGADVLEADEENPPRQEWPQGKGLKRAAFTTVLSAEEAAKVDKIYINVEKRGSSSTSYAGAYSGSGKGVVIDMSDYRRN